MHQHRRSNLSIRWSTLEGWNHWGITPQKQIYFPIRCWLQITVILGFDDVGAFAEVAPQQAGDGIFPLVLCSDISLEMNFLQQLHRSFPTSECVRWFVARSSLLYWLLHRLFLWLCQAYWSAACCPRWLWGAPLDNSRVLIPWLFIWGPGWSTNEWRKWERAGEQNQRVFSLFLKLQGNRNFSEAVLFFWSRKMKGHSYVVKWDGLGVSIQNQKILKDFLVKLTHLIRRLFAWCRFNAKKGFGFIEPIDEAANVLDKDPCFALLALLPSWRWTFIECSQVSWTFFGHQMQALFSSWHFAKDLFVHRNQIQSGEPNRLAFGIFLGSLGLETTTPTF